MKFCWSTLFEAGRALLKKKWKIYSRKKSMVLTVKAVLQLISSHLKNIMANKCLAKPSRTLLQRLHEENQLWFSNSKHFQFYWKKKHFISELYFTKNHETGSLVVRKVKKSGDSRQNRELGPAWESKSNCRSFHHIYHLDESKIFKSS